LVVFVLKNTIILFGSFHAMTMRKPSTDHDEILLLGDPRLRIVSEPVTDFSGSEYVTGTRHLTRALDRFRAEHGFGRAISAPQIGIPLRMIAMNLGKGTFMLVNPELSGLSVERFTMWDDCMSFPWLIVRVQRHRSLNLCFRNEQGISQTWDGVEQSVSELLQHEVDHLNGILAVDRAIDHDSLIARAVYESQRDFFDAQVDYAIQPTVP
jgi:peptide deformylase